MRSDHALMRFMVWNMRLMTRYVGVLARPLVRAYAGREVIACGLRRRDGQVAIIYTPAPGRTGHHVRLHHDRQWRPVPSVPAADFSGGVVSQVLVPDARRGQRYRMSAVDHRGRPLSSPTITVKETTIYDPMLLTVAPSSAGSASFSWALAQSYDAMIYFLAVEDASGVTHAAVYTREPSWTYPDTRAASLCVGPARPAPLLRSAPYRTTLVLVDYDGWVSHIAERTVVPPP